MTCTKSKLWIQDCPTKETSRTSWDALSFDNCCVSLHELVLSCIDTAVARNEKAATKSKEQWPGRNWGEGLDASRQQEE